MARFWIVFILILGGRLVSAQLPKKVNVRLPVATRIEDKTLEPGSYQVDIVEEAAGHVKVQIRKAEREEVLATAEALAIDNSEKIERNAVKVIFRDGLYFLDKLLIAGEHKSLQFRP